MYYAYLLRCADDTLYAGYTDDLSKRVAVHNQGKGAKYTRANKPIKIVYTKEFDNKSDALKEEFRIKHLTKEEKIKLIEN